MGISVFFKQDDDNKCWFSGSAASSYPYQLTHFASTLFNNNQVTTGQITGLSTSFAAPVGWTKPTCVSSFTPDFGSYFAYRLQSKDGNIVDKAGNELPEDGEECECKGEGGEGGTSTTNSGLFAYNNYVLSLSDCLIDYGIGYRLDPLCEDGFCLFNTGYFCYKNTAFNYGCYNMVKDNYECTESKASRQDKYDSMNKDGCDCRELNSGGGKESPSAQKPSSECNSEMSEEDCEELKKECEALTPCPMNIYVKYKTVANVSVKGCAIDTSFCSAFGLSSTLGYAATTDLNGNVSSICADFIQLLQ